MTSVEAVRPAITKLVRRLVRELKPQTVILFGSYAYGVPNEDSDVDLFIVQESNEPPSSRTQRISEIAREVLKGSLVQPIVYTREQLEGRLNVGDHFIQEILDRGVLLYGKSWREERCSIVVEDESAYPAEWLERAERDLRWVAIGFREDDPAAAGYYLQQALEKFLRAFLVAHGWRLQRIHTLEKLLDDALHDDPSLAEYRSLCVTVTKWYMADRYPRTEEPPTDEQARAALETAQVMIDRLRRAVTARRPAP